KPSANVKTCTEACVTRLDKCPVEGISCPQSEKRISADEWTVSLVTLPPNAPLESQPVGPTLLIAVTKLELARQSYDAVGQFKRPSGGLDWIPGGLKETIRNNSSKPAQLVTLEFKPEQQKQ
ncbi:MAG TPA: hypothetical protein VNB54_09715, partial [Alphaproteobacteria bacterium]|nr:hypothetical protein [Alphaproteobacteria bacterium]